MAYGTITLLAFGILRECETACVYFCVQFFSKSNKLRVEDIIWGLKTSPSLL